MSKFLPLIPCLVIATGLSFSVLAQTSVTINPQKDNTLYEDGAGALSNGSGGNFFAGRTSGGDIRRALLKFDIAGQIPAGSTINSVTLTLNMSQTINGAQTITLHTVNQDWGEGGSVAAGNGGGGAASQSNDATWIHTFYNSSFWTAIGGDFNPTSSASTSVNGLGTYNWSAAQMTTDVQNWLDNPGTNFGWLLKGNESTFPTTKRFDSRENSIANNRPKLLINYTAPPPSPKMIINEVDYDQDGTDTREFIELYNPSSTTINLSLYTIELFDGGGSTVYQTIALPNRDVAPGDYYVVCANAATGNCDTVVTPATDLIENGAPDAIGLRNNGVMEDALSYEGSSASPYTESFGAGTDDSSITNAGLSRFPNGTDTDDNSADFKFACITPGAANLGSTSLCFINVNAGNNRVICYRDTTILGGTFPTGGQPPYTYHWSPGASLVDSTVFNARAFPLTTTTYTLTVTDQNNIQYSDEVKVTVNPPPTIDAGTDTTICLGSSVRLGGMPTATGGSGPYTFSWTPQSSELGCVFCTNPFATPSSSGGSYTLEVTDNKGCSVFDTVNIDVHPPIIIQAGNDKNICQGDTTLLGGNPTGQGGSGPLSLQWTPSAGLSCTTCPKPLAFPTTATTYTLVITDSASCSVTDSVTVSVFPSDTIHILPLAPVRCAGDTVTLTAQPGYAAYMWYSASGSYGGNRVKLLSFDTTTEVIVLGSKAGGCFDTGWVTVTVNPLPDLQISPQDSTVCLGSCVDFTVSGAASYMWNTGGNSATETVCSQSLGVGTHNIIVMGTSANNCTAADTASFTVKALPQVTASSDVTLCLGSSAMLGVNGNATSYLWTPPDSLSCTTCPNPTANPTSTTVYTVTGTALNGCQESDAVSVTVVPNLDVQITPGTTAICPGESDTLVATGATFYTWQPSTGLNASTGNTVIASPAFTITYTVIGSSGSCMDTGYVTVTVHPGAVINAGSNQTICQGESATLTATGNTVSQTWMPGNLSGSQVSVTPSTPTQYTVTGTTIDGCIGSDVVQVFLNSVPTVNAGNDTSFCSGDSTTLQVTASGNGPFQYSWSPAGQVSCVSCAFTRVFNAGCYSVVAIDANTCEGMDTVCVTVDALPSISGSADTMLCLGDTITLSATGAGINGSYAWSPASSIINPNNANPLVFPNATTQYSVTGTDMNGCKGEDSTLVAVNIPEPVNAGPDQSIIAGQTTTLTATGNNNSYVWNPGNLSGSTVSVNPLTTTCYTVEATDDNGCTSVDEVCVTVFGVGIDDPDWARGINLYPSPTSGEGILEIKVDRPVTLEWQLFDATGRYVASDTRYLAAGNNVVPLSLINEANGVYHIRLMIDDESIDIKWLKQ